MPALVVTFGAVATIFSAPAQNLGFPMVTSFSTNDLGTNVRSWVTVQDTDGVLYFGCDALVSYDGARWRNTPLREAYALRDLDFGRDGRLWFVANGDLGWFERDAGARWQLHSLRANLPREHAVLGEMWRVFAENDGAVFVSENKILRWDGKAFRVWALPGSPRLPAYRCGGRIFVQHPPTGLYELGADGPRLVIPAALFDGAWVFWMEPRGDGWMLATAHGLFLFSAGRMEAIAPEVSAYVHREALTSVARLPDGRLALGTYRGGIVLARADGSLERILTEDDGLPTRAIFSVFVDREGGLWATSPSHIFRIAAAAPTAIFDRRAGLPDLPVLKIARDESGIVVANDRGVFRLLPDEEKFAPVESLRDRLMDLRSTERGLLAANFRGVELVSIGRVTKLFAGEQQPSVAQSSERWPGSFLISTGHNIVRVDAVGQARTLVRDLPDIATSIAEAGGDEIWLGTLARGILVARLDDAVAVEATPAAGTRGLPAFHGAGQVVATRSGAVVAFTPEGGWLLGRDEKSFTPITDFPVRDVSAFTATAADDSVWVVHRATGERPACLARILVDGSHATWQPHSVEGLASIGEPRALFVETSPTNPPALWIGGANGLLHSVVRAGPVAPTPRVPLLRAFARSSESGELQPIAGALPYATRAVVFEFAAPEFSRRQSLRLETRADGLDRDWVAAASNAQREFTAVRDGAYTFHVRAVAETGATSEAAVFQFVVLPPWWRTTPAAAGALAIFAMAAYLAYSLRVRALNRRNVELEAKVRERTEELAEASAAKTQFVANMSHDIRNPLNGIVGLAVALENTRLDSRQREIVATLRECTGYLSTLVDDVLDFASIEAGHVELRPGPFVPAELLRSVVATLKADADQRGATLVIEAAGDLPPVLRGDASRIQQILVNYVTNALKYAGGRIVLSASVPRESRDEVEFAVIDEGPGIGEAEQAALFTKFMRVADERVARIKGAGLGLASCRLLADIMSGSVGVVSRAGHGAKFFLRLPLEICEAPPVAAWVALPQVNVLVVEDADYNAWAAGAVLAKLGLAHERARTGAEALAMFKAKRFHVVLLDHNLPDMDGTEVARRIRTLEEDGPRAVLLAVTAYCAAEDRARCLAAGMDAFVGKPLTPEKLRAMLLGAGRRLLTAASVHGPADTHAAPRASDINFSLLNYLSDGTDASLDEQVDRFLVALAEAESELMRVLAARDRDALGDAAHRVLSQAKMIDCAPLAEVALALELAARAGRAATVDELVAPVQREIAALTAALRHRHPAAHIV